MVLKSESPSKEIDEKCILEEFSFIAKELLLLDDKVRDLDFGIVMLCANVFE